MLNRLSFLISFVLLIFSLFTYGQNNTKKQLELKRIELLKEIKNTQSLINKSKDNKKLIFENIENLNYKLDLQNQVIRLNNDELNILSNSIEQNKIKIDLLIRSQEALKKQYAEMILRSFKTRSKTQKLMFIFSSGNFQQALKRIQYFKQYSDHQYNQLLKIKSNTLELKQLEKSLLSQKQLQLNLISKNTKIKNSINLEIDNKNSLLKIISNNQIKYTNEIKKKQKRTTEIDRQIEKIIADAIAESNKKKSLVFELTPEAKALSNSFILNKGKLPWPVSQGRVILKYGRQPHPIVKTATIQSNGIRIMTSPAQKVRSIFNGSVYRIISSKNGSKTILIQHGNFFTVYKNLSNIYVKKGEKVSTMQELGNIITNKNSGQTILSFSLFKESKTQNPLYWLGQK